MESTLLDWIWQERNNGLLHPVAADWTLNTLGGFD
jgi:hypothetical protein